MRAFIDATVDASLMQHQGQREAAYAAAGNHDIHGSLSNLQFQRMPSFYIVMYHNKLDVCLGTGTNPYEMQLGGWGDGVGENGKYQERLLQKGARYCQPTGSVIRCSQVVCSSL